MHIICVLLFYAPLHTHTIFFNKIVFHVCILSSKKDVPPTFEDKPTRLEREDSTRIPNIVLVRGSSLMKELTQTDLCVFSWALQAAGSENALWQSLQLKGFSPVWMRMCLLKFPVCVNFFPQSWNRSVAINIFETHVFHLQCMKFVKN